METDPVTPLDYFATLVSPPDDGEDIPLTEAALAIAQITDPRLDLATAQSDLDRFAATLKARLPADAGQVHKLRLLNRYFFHELGFAGNANDYYDPANSFLPRVIERRRGIPISLAVLLMEIGHQVGLPLRGVAFPGHFLVKLKVRAGDLYLDPMTGESLSREQLEERLSEFLDALREKADHADGSDATAKLGREPFELALAQAIREASSREILARMLRNLKGIYHGRNDYEHLLEIQNRLVVLLPEANEELRDRGLVYAQLECPRAASEDLSAYLARAPDAPEAAEIRRTLDVLRDASGRLN
jgi:regulator of sirC expression with transglutaminase-like and TPR domain